MNTKSRGPGPGAYILPPTVGFNQHDVRKQRGPQYSFGTFHKDMEKRCGPGPGAYKLEKVYRYGMDGTAKYSMAKRIDLPEKCRGPGPAAHDVRNKPFFKGTSAPAYSLRTRSYPITEKLCSPPPNTYCVRVSTIKPAAPAYSMGIGLMRKPQCRSPGPATYGRTDLNVKLNKSPAYSLTGRNLYAFKTCSPGPNVYDMSYYRPGKSRPAYSFGIRHNDYAPPMVVQCDNP